MSPSVRSLAVLLCLLAVACSGAEDTRVVRAAARALPPRGPVATVERRLHELRTNDLAGYARHSVPPALYAELETAWSAGRSRWPLTELPLDERLPGVLVSLSQPKAEAALSASYRREFAGAHAELRSAADTLGTLGERHLLSDKAYSANEREHYLQLVDALVHWGQRAPLGEPSRARHAIARLTAAARDTGLGSEQALSDAGLRGSLRRLGPFFGQLKQVLAGYGLEIDTALEQARVELVREQGDRAQVRLHYTLAKRPVEAMLDMQRIDGRWYLSDALAHARAQLPPAPLASEALAAQAE